eukprot:CAMPEP_0114489534 /NCGR_PEP_ID=MMETSP0109-20121206/1942_1 /TAXON_ID=29199 /ORGANISM="Chlorarachnion reptans, Strain CCCM449" /LENGTH=1094 /DNA_ID=CAMNT_0001666055 /DNA_START=35 /DNA_END=3320 /DNA_ORIENTATION=+
MAAIVMVRVYGARNLPVMDSARNTTDAYVVIRLGEKDNHSNFQMQKKETRICYNSLHPVWDQSFRFKLMDETLIYENPLRLTVFDKDTFSANDPIGTVVIGLASMLSHEKATQRLSGWFPLYDTLKGIVERPRPLQRVAGACPSFYSASLIDGYEILRYHGFVDELIVSADPEHRWQGLISGARKTNESRQLLFYTMAGQVQQNISRKASALGANAVIGYRFDIDFEGSHGVIARGYGTAVFLNKLEEEVENQNSNEKTVLEFIGDRNRADGTSNTDTKHGLGGPNKKDQRNSAEQTDVKRKRNRDRKNRETGLFPPPRASPLVSRPEKRKHPVEFLTVDKLPSEKAQYLLGGAVNSRAVHLITGKRAKQDLRDEWWAEVRDEIRSHAQSLQCTHILGYRERTTIYDDICVLSASGTAVKILSSSTRSHRRRGLKFSARLLEKGFPPCCRFHSPYSRRNQLSKSSLGRCRACNNGHVPETLLSTVVPPPDPYYSTGGLIRQGSLNREKQLEDPQSNEDIRGKLKIPLMLRESRQLVEARVCRKLPRLQGEAKAMQISENVLFIQYDLYRQLVYKLRVLGLNAAFGLQVQLSLGENLIAAVATATGCYVTALPPPALLKISRNIEVKDNEDRELFAIQKKIMRAGTLNHEHWQNRLQNLISLSIPTFQKSITAPSTVSLPARYSTPPTSPNRSSHGTDAKVPGMPSPITPLPPAQPLDGLDPPLATSTLPPKSPAPFSGSPKIGAAQEESTSSSSDTDDEADGRRKFVLHVDDEADEDIMAVLLEPRMQCFLNTPLANDELKSRAVGGSTRLLTFIRRVRWNNVPSHKLNQKLAAVFEDLYASLQFKSKGFACNVQSQVIIPEENEIEIVLTAVALPAYARHKGMTEWGNSFRENESRASAKVAVGSLLDLDGTKPTGSESCLAEKKLISVNGIGEEKKNRTMHSERLPGEWLLPKFNGPLAKEGLVSIWGPTPDMTTLGGDSRIADKEYLKSTYGHVQLSTLERLPARAVSQHLGRISVHIIRESFNEKRGTLARFTHELLAQINLIARAHVSARGGNALLSYALLEYQVDQESTRQSYSIMSLSGDAVLLADE